jgi:parvulin-like peptidyl-prolyl isomerase
MITNQLIEPVLAAVPTVAEHVHARHILVNSEAEAQDILARLNAGEDFAALAGQYSVDVTSKDNGGDLGWFPRGGLLVPEVEEAAFSMTPGQLSSVIQTGWGYHIVQTLEFAPEREIAFETRQRLIERAIEQWRLGLRDGADIQILSTF